MRNRSILILAALLCVSVPAAAQNYDRPGPYLALNGVIAVETFDGTGGLDFDTGFGVSPRLGYRIDERFAVEGQLEYSGTFEEDDFFGGDLEASALVYTLNGKFYFASQQLQPYVGLGIGGESFEVDGPGVHDDDSAFVVRFAGGLDYYLTEQIGLMGEFAYNLSTGDLDDARYLAIGFGAFYRF